MELTDSLLNKLVPNSSLKICASLTPYLNPALLAYEVTTQLRVAHFIAQVGHESGSFVYFGEIWGPTTAQLGYEGRKDLGNTQKGWGSKYRGYGLIQTTGHANVVSVRDRLRKRFPNMLVPDFELLPQLLKEPKWAVYSATDFWAMKNINPLADIDDCVAVTKKVNGGTNGLKDRQARLAVAKRVLGI